jgi:Na+-transporting NADH:ubiquinone oxidoreductase subunit C
VQSRNHPGYTVLFSAAICLVCAVMVSTAAVSLRERQQANAELDRRMNVLRAAGVMREGEVLPREEVERRFGMFQIVAVDLRTGEEDVQFDPQGYDPRRAQANPMTSMPAPRNEAAITRVPHHALVYKMLDEQGELELIVLPIEGMGLWATMYGFVALGPDLRTVRGLTYYQHGETPGLGGEVDNPRWKALWPGREAFDEQNRPVIQVVRGLAGPVAQDPHRVDGLAGATITSRGVTAMLRFWLGEHGFGRYLDRLREEGTHASTT